MKRFVGAILSAVGFFAVASPSSAATDLLPDLGMAKLSTIRIDTTTMPGHKLLRYTAVIVNVGQGPLDLVGSRADTTTPTMSVVQQIHDTDGGYRTVPVNTTMYYSGDGHNHWHTKDIEGGRLTRLDNGLVVGVLEKHGFCFYDNVKYRLTLPDAPQLATFLRTGCAPNLPDALSAHMGLSVGWGDTYPYTTNLQWIDITGLPNGKYQLRAIADPQHVTTEVRLSNNAAWANVRITSTGVKVLRYGPGA